MAMISNTTASDQDILKLISQGVITLPALPDSEILTDDEQQVKAIQPSGLDLRVGDKAWLMRGSARPLNDETVESLIGGLALREFDLTQDTDLLQNSVYLVELQESVDIGRHAHLRANPKSSSGRIDLLTRLLTDNNQHYDSVRGPYKGKLYAEVVPSSFHCILRKGTSINQLRYSLGNPVMPDDEIRSVLTAQSLTTLSMLYRKSGEPILQENAVIDNGLVLSVDLNGKYTNAPEIIGYRAKKNIGLKINLQQEKQYSWTKFFEPISPPADGTLTLEPGNFYLLSTNEAVAIPPGFAGELAQFDPRVGHITSHYAGFFDPGFGYFSGGEKQGNTATLEVRVHNKPEVIRDGQPICVLHMERMAQTAASPYGGEGRKSHYRRQIGVTYSKHFREVA